jgi:hypothetical protein
LSDRAHTERRNSIERRRTESKLVGCLPGEHLNFYNVKYLVTLHVSSMSVEVVKTFQGHSKVCRGYLMRYLTTHEISHEKLMRYLTTHEISHEISHQAGLIEDHSIIMESRALWLAGREKRN